MADDKNTEAELAALVARVADAASAFIRGDIREYVRLIPHARRFRRANT